MIDTRRRGAVVEAAAREHLLQAGLRDIAANAQYRVGEIDLVMRDGDTLVFVEVRYRRDARFGGGSASVDAGKQRKLVRAAAQFLATHREFRDAPCRFDVIDAGGDPQAPTIEWLRDAFAPTTSERVPSIFTHAAVPLAMWLAAGPRRISTPLLAAGIAASMSPDLDVAAFAFGIPYADSIGHRGASHSLLFAAVLGVIAAIAHTPLRSRPSFAGGCIFVCAASHPLLDAMTSGGLGVALWWPWSDARVFAPWRPIRVSPFANGFFSARGVATLWSELRWVWLPLLVGASLWRLLHRHRGAVDTQ